MKYATKQEYRKAWDNAYTEDPPIPLNLDLELASTCNAKCTFCLYGDSDWFKGMNEKDWDGKPKKRFMDPELAVRLINEAASIGIPALKVNFRGESTLHKDYTPILVYAAKHGGFHEILVNTNGNCPEGSIYGLMKATKVMVSLDSMVPETYAKIRVGLSLEKAIKTIDELVLRKHPDLWVRRVVCKDNNDEEFAKAVRARWPSGVKVSEHYAFDRNHYQNQSVTVDDWTKWPRTYCGYPSQRIVVEASGKYVPCCIAWEGEFDAGNFQTTSLREYWASEWRRNLANELRDGILKNKKCQNCTSFMAYQRPEREFVKDVEASIKI